eukprot:IDg2960t1
MRRALQVVSEEACNGCALRQVGAKHSIIIGVTTAPIR